MVWFIILSILWKKNNPEHPRKNSKVFRVVRREGDFFTTPTVFASAGFIEKKIVLRWNEYFFCSYMGPNQLRENNGPNVQLAQCITPSAFYQDRYIQRYLPATKFDFVFMFL